MTASTAPDEPSRWLFEGKQYSVMRASDVDLRDGYGWELYEGNPGDADRRYLMEAFYDDSTAKYTFSCEASDDLPLALVQHFLSEAAKGIGPSSE